MKRPFPHDGIVVNTSRTLEKVQAALTLAKQTGNDPLYAAAESVLSALVLTLRRRNSTLSKDLLPRLLMIDQALGVDK